MIPRILVIAGSLRAASLNAALARVASLELAGLGADVTRLSLEDYPLPLFDGDLAGAAVLPVPAARLARLVTAHAGIFIAAPEYNGSIAPLVTNMIDWVSLCGPGRDPAASPWAGRVVALASATDRPGGGLRALDHLGTVFGELGADLAGSAAFAEDAGPLFDPEGWFSDPDMAARLAGLSAALYEGCMIHRAL